MVSDPFDVFTARVAAQLTRRRTVGLFGLVGAASLGLAEVTAAKKKRKGKKCSKCKSCQKCVKGKCKAKPDGTPCPEGRTCQGGKCLCPPGTANCQNGLTATCCPNGEACLPGSICGACPVTGFCEQGEVVFCGDVSNSQCICVTSVEGVTVCSSQNGLCLDCTSDEQCTNELGVPAVCVEATGNACSDVGGCPALGETVCTTATCD